MTQTEGGDSRQNLGFSGIIQVNKMQPSLSDYPVGGYSISPSAFGMGELHGMWLIGQGGTASNYLWKWNKSTSSLQVYGSGASAGATLQEIAVGTDLSSGQYYFLGFGF
jgi:hypothetical protein